MSNEHLDIAIETTLAAEVRLQEIFKPIGLSSGIPSVLPALIIAAAIDSAATKIADAITAAKA